MADAILNAGDVYGPFLVGLMFCCVLYGITAAQTVYYFRTYSSDIMLLKCLVGLCLFFDTVHIALVIETLHYWYIVCRLPENYQFLPIFRISFGSSICVTYALTSIVQAFYIWRVWTLSKRNKIIVGIISALSVIQLLGGTVLTADLFIDTHIAAVHGRISEIGGSIELVSTLICDLLISGSLVYFLNKSRTGFYGTENIINRLIIYSVNVGLFTSVIALCNLVFWLALPASFLFAAFHIIISKFYVNSMLVTLNSRKSVRDQLQNSRGNTSSSGRSRDFHDVPTGGGDFALSTFPVDKASDPKSAGF